MTRDWNFKSGNAVCELRAAGILIHDGKVLFDHVMATDEYWLPGGHVQIGELSKAALIREFAEEFDAAIKIKSRIYVSEFFSHWEGYQTNVVQFEYEISAKSLKMDFDQDEERIEKVWLSADELDKLKIVPEDLKSRLERIR